MSSRREVTSDEFWAYIKALTINVHPRIITGYPYTSAFMTQDGSEKEHGRIVSEYIHPELKCGLTKNRYYLPN